VLSDTDLLFRLIPFFSEICKLNLATTGPLFKFKGDLETFIKLAMLKDEFAFEHFLGKSSLENFMGFLSKFFSGYYNIFFKQVTEKVSHAISLNPLNSDLQSNIIWSLIKSYLFHGFFLEKLEKLEELKLVGLEAYEAFEKEVIQEQLIFMVEKEKDWKNTYELRAFTNTSEDFFLKVSKKFSELFDERMDFQEEFNNFLKKKAFSFDEG